jgi:hypothetical protein
MRHTNIHIDLFVPLMPVQTRSQTRGQRRQTSRTFPYEIVHNRRKKCYTVRRKFPTKGTRKRKVFAKCTTKAKAQRQMYLLAAIMYNPRFRPR